MMSPRKKVDRYSYEWETGMAKAKEESMRARLAAFDADSDKPGRARKHECKCCFYLHSPRMAGQAFTKRQCGLCDEIVTHGNTNCPVVCDKCAALHGLCRNCGGDINMKVRRKIKLTPTAEVVKDA